MIALDRFFKRTESADVVQSSGVVLRVVGLAVVASGPAVPVGETCSLRLSNGEQRIALVTGFREGEIILQPIGHLDGIRPGDLVIARHRTLDIPIGPGLIGRVIDGVGNPLDGKGPLIGSARRPIAGDPPPALSRTPISRIMETGLKAIDALFTIGHGQRMGIFAGSGVGKSTLLGEMAKHARADVNVIALVGERGREVGEFVDKVLGAEGLARSVVVVATSDRPSVERLSAAYAATAIADSFRDADDGFGDAPVPSPTRDRLGCRRTTGDAWLSAQRLCHPATTPRTGWHWAIRPLRRQSRSNHCFVYRSDRRR